MTTRINQTALLASAVLLSACAAGPSGLDAPVDTARPIIITQHGSAPPNSADGVNFRAQFRNQSGKTVKYIEFTVAARNRVGDLAVDSIRRHTETVLDFTGPLEHGKSAGRPFPVQWASVWYNSTISCAMIRKVKVIYMDSTSVEFAGDGVNALVAGAPCSAYN